MHGADCTPRSHERRYRRPDELPYRIRDERPYRTNYDTGRTTIPDTRRTTIPEMGYRISETGWIGRYRISPLSHVRNPASHCRYRRSSGIGYRGSHRVLSTARRQHRTTDVPYPESRFITQPPPGRPPPTAQPRVACSLSDNTRWNSVKSESSVKMVSSRRFATAQIRKSVLDPWIPAARH